MCVNGRFYTFGTLASMFLYAVAIVGLAFASRSGLLAGPALYAAVLLPGAAIAMQLWVTLRYLRDADEFVRGVMNKRFLLAAMLSCVVATTWGFYETFANAPHVPAWYIYPLFWFLVGVVTPFIRTTH